MRFRELRILADENISPRVVGFLREQTLDVLDVKEQGWHGKADDELLEIADRDQRWLLTHDADFGTLAIHEGKPCFGLIYLRLKNLQRRNVIGACRQLLQSEVDLPPHALAVVEENRIRLRLAESG